jgi:hypothetical protein
MVENLMTDVVDFLTSWAGFGLLVAVVAIMGVLLWRRWRRWNPVDGSSAEAKQAQARLFAVRFGGERR